MNSCLLCSPSHLLYVLFRCLCKIQTSLMFWSIMSIGEWWTMSGQQMQNQTKSLRLPSEQFRPGTWNTVSSEVECIHTVYSCISSWNYIFIYSLIILNPVWRIKTCSLYPTESPFFALSYRNPLFLGLRPWNYKSEGVDKCTASLNRTSVSQWRVNPSLKNKVFESQ